MFAISTEDARFSQNSLERLFSQKLTVSSKNPVEDARRMNALFPVFKTEPFFKRDGKTNGSDCQGCFGFFQRRKKRTSKKRKL